MVKIVRVVGIIGAIIGTWGVGSAQPGEIFKGRFASLPVAPATAPTSLGSGSFTATLRGDVLTISGKFEGMNSPATLAHVHRAPKGRRGPNVGDLIVPHATEGTVTGDITFTASQLEALRNGGYYIQIHTERNPEGQLRGWILK